MVIINVMHEIGLRRTAHSCIDTMQYFYQSATDVITT